MKIYMAEIFCFVLVIFIITIIIIIIENYPWNSLLTKCRYNNAIAKLASGFTNMEI